MLNAFRWRSIVRLRQNALQDGAPKTSRCIKLRYGGASKTRQAKSELTTEHADRATQRSDATTPSIGTHRGASKFGTREHQRRDELSRNSRRSTRTERHSGLARNNTEHRDTPRCIKLRYDGVPKTRQAESEFTMEHADRATQRSDAATPSIGTHIAIYRLSVRRSIITHPDPHSTSCIVRGSHKSLSMTEQAEPPCVSGTTSGSHKSSTMTEHEQPSRASGTTSGLVKSESMTDNGAVARIKHGK